MIRSLVKVTAWGTHPGRCDSEDGPGAAGIQDPGVSPPTLHSSRTCCGIRISCRVSTRRHSSTEPLPCSLSESAGTGQTRILRYIADVTVNGNPETAGRMTPTGAVEGANPAAAAQRGRPASPPKQVLTERGPKGLADWILNQDRLLVTDTTMRDAPPVHPGNAHAFP